MKWIAVFFLLIGCETEMSVGTPIGLDSSVESTDSEKNVCVEGWICWNPESSQHGEPCTSGCMVKGDNTKYCYMSMICNKK
jgi:hypothetical protein